MSEKISHSQTFTPSTSIHQSICAIMRGFISLIFVNFIIQLSSCQSTCVSNSACKVEGLNTLGYYNLSEAGAQQRSLNQNVESCRSLCRDHESCQHFTWYGRDGAFPHICFLFSTCESVQISCHDCHSGPEKCSDTLDSDCHAIDTARGGNWLCFPRPPGPESAMMHGTRCLFHCRGNVKYHKCHLGKWSQSPLMAECSCPRIKIREEERHESQIVCWDSNNDNNEEDQYSKGSYCIHACHGHPKHEFVCNADGNWSLDSNSLSCYDSRPARLIDNVGFGDNLEIDVKVKDKLMQKVRAQAELIGDEEENLANFGDEFGTKNGVDEFDPLLDQVQGPLQQQLVPEVVPEVVRDVDQTHVEHVEHKEEKGEIGLKSEQVTDDPLYADDPKPLSQKSTVKTHESKSPVRISYKLLTTKPTMAPFFESTATSGHKLSANFDFNQNKHSNEAIIKGYFDGQSETTSNPYIRHVSPQPFSDSQNHYQGPQMDYNQHGTQNPEQFAQPLHQPLIGHQGNQLEVTHQPQVVPHQTQVVPHQPQVVPHQTQVVPHQAQVVPHQDQVVPHQPQVVPHQAQEGHHQAQVGHHQPQVVPHQAQEGHHHPQVVPHQAQVGHHQPHPSPQPPQVLPYSTPRDVAKYTLPRPEEIRGLKHVPLVHEQRLEQRGQREVRQGHLSLQRPVAFQYVLDTEIVRQDSIGVPDPRREKRRNINNNNNNNNVNDVDNVSKPSEVSNPFLGSIPFSRISDNLISSSKCSRPLDPANGYMECASGLEEGSNCSLICHVGFVNVGSALFTCTEGSWVAHDQRVGCEKAVAAAIIGGWNPDRGTLSDVEVLDLRNASSCTLPPLPSPRKGHVAFLQQNKLIACGGLNDTSKLNKCFELAEDGWKETSNTESERHFASHVVHGDHVLLLGGRDGRQRPVALKSTEIRANSEWRTSKEFELTKERAYHCAMSRDSNAIITGGYSYNEVINLVEAANLANWKNSNSSWQLWPALKESRYLHACTTLPDQRGLLVSGGYSQTGYLDSTEMFEDKEWREVGRLSEPRQGGRMAVINDQVIVLGGFNRLSRFPESVEQFDLKEEKWTVLKDHKLKLPRRYFAMVPLPKSFLNKFC